MLERALRWIVGVAVVIAFLVPASLPVGMPADVLLSPTGVQTAGNYYAWTNYKSNYYGVQAHILVTNPTVSSGSEVAAFVTVVMPNNGWLQTGWVKGLTPGGSTGSNVWFYTEYCTHYPGCSSSDGSYVFTNQGTATVGTTHTFLVTYSGCQQSCTEYRWYAFIDGVSKASVPLQQKNGVLQAEAESHNTLDHMPQGHFYSLQYWIPYGRGWQWFAWDGYGSTGHDSPFTQTIISNTEWYYTEN